MRFQLWLLAAFGLLYATVCPAEEPPAGEKQAAKPAPRITIGKDTTYVTGPLRKDGTIDFVAAVNAHASQGVTPENNAAIPFWRVVGPQEIHEPMRVEFFQKLGMENLPIEGDYLLGFNEYLKLVETGKLPGKELLNSQDGPDSEAAQEKRNALLEQEVHSYERPWQAKEFPLVAGWVQKNSELLDQIQEATRRTRFYFPFLTGADEGEYSALAALLLPGLQEARNAARMLTSRAMLHISEGKLAEAQADLLACHRLGRLVGQGQTLIEGLVGIAIDGTAEAGDRALASSGKLTAKQLLAYAGELRALPVRPAMMERLNFMERLMFIDCVSMVEKGGFKALTILTGGEARIPGFLSDLTVKLVEWDTVLRFGNSWFDRLVDAGNEADLAKQQAAFDKFDAELKQLSKEAGDYASFANQVATQGLQAAMTERTGKIFISLLMPALGAARNAEIRSHVNDGVTQLALALAAYRADQGKYPAELAALMPKYIERIPLDLFSNQPLHYHVTKTGYLLYSVGMNGKDEAGRNRQNPGSEPNETGDDLAVRVGEEE